MDDHATTAALSSHPANPVLVEATRGEMVECRFHGAFALADNEGRILAAAGDIERPVYPRSAVKPLQALALVESGAAEAFGLGSKEVALACASHGAEPRHLQAVAAWLKRLGLSEADLECGAHPPTYPASEAARIRDAISPGPFMNNCSGKHSGFLTLAIHRGWETRGYIAYEHPVQATLRQILGEMADYSLEAAPWGLDGCSIPTIALPLNRIALAMARLARPEGLAPQRAAACRRIAQAMAEEPYMVAGRNRCASETMARTSGRVLLKSGAEGVYCAFHPGRGLGLALKVDDGRKEASEVLIGAILRRHGLLEPAELTDLRSFFGRDIANAAGRIVGRFRVAEEELLGEPL